MRILHVTDVYLPRLGGIEVLVDDLASHQRRFGHTAQVLTSTPDSSPGPAPEINAKTAVEIKDGWMPRDEMIRPDQAPTVRLGNAMFSPVAELIRSFRPDTVHCHSSIVSPLAWRTARYAAGQGIPVLVTMHSMVPSSGPVPATLRRLAQAMNERRNGGAAAVIDVFIEIDVGQGRCGVEPGAPAVTLVLEIRKHPALRFAGLQAYHGKAQHMRSAQERREAIAKAVEDVVLTKKLIEAQGITVDLVTGAGTGSLMLEAFSGVYGELQAGSFMFMDADYAKNERDPAQPQFEHALFVKTQVVSTHGGHAVCDAGHKSHAIDSGLPLVHAFDTESELEYFNGGDEHGILRPAGDSKRLPGLGRMLWLIPGHCDPTVNLHDVMIGVTGGLRSGTVQRIFHVDARGALT